MDEQKKKKIKIGVITAIAIAGISIAAVTANNTVNKKVKSGTVEIASIDLKIQNQSGEFVEELPNWDPGDVNMIKWNVKNEGTAAIYTRNTLSIYWNENIEDLNPVLFLYPANMSKKDIIEDYKKGNNSEYAIQVGNSEITLENGEKKKGIKYTFLGDELDGSEMVVSAQEVNYDSKDFPEKTNENSALEDNVAFNILLSPNTPGSYGDKSLTIEVVTEAMQHTDDGKAEWKIVDKSVIGQ